MKKRTPQSRARLVYVLLIVFLICGSNGAGLVAGGILWRATGKLALALLGLLGLTGLGLALAVVVILCVHRIAAEQSPQKGDPSGAE